MACEKEGQETVDTPVECCEEVAQEVEEEAVCDAEVEAEAEPCCEADCACHESASDETVTRLLNKANDGIDVVNGLTRRVFQEVREMHRLYHAEFAGRLRKVQEELDRYHEIDKGRVFDDILRELARLYSENIDVLENVSDASAKKQLSYMFMDILQLLNNSGVHEVKTQIGEKRDTRHSRVVDRQRTDDEQKHGTVLASHNVGFRVENRTLVDELVDVYIYAHKPEEQKS